MQKVFLILFLAQMTNICLSKNEGNGCGTKNCNCNVVLERETYVVHEESLKTFSFNLTCNKSSNIYEIKENLKMDLKNSSLYRVNNWTIIDESLEEAGITGRVEIEALVTGEAELEIFTKEKDCIVKKTIFLKVRAIIFKTSKFAQLNYQFVLDTTS